MRSALRLASKPRRLQQQQPAAVAFRRYLAKSTTATNKTTPTTWAEQKQAAKNRRRELYEGRQARKQRLQTRRDHVVKGEKRQAFRSWFIPQKVNDEYHQRKARQAGLDWQIQVAVILERINVVLPDMEDWEREYEHLQGHLMQFGKDYPKALFPPPDIVPMEEAVASEEDLYAMLEARGYTPAPRETVADASGDVRTTDRKLKTSIFLTVQQQQQQQQQEAKTNKWQLPTVDLQEGETFLQAAKRAIPEIAGEQVEFWCPSNCPCAVDVEPFEQPKNGSYGVKTFFMKVQYDEGTVAANSSKITDYAWLDRTEIMDRMREQDGEDASKFYRYLL